MKDDDVQVGRILFRRGGDQLLLDVIERGEGYAATFDIGLQID